MAPGPGARAAVTGALFLAIFLLGWAYGSRLRTVPPVTAEPVPEAAPGDTARAATPVPDSTRGAR